MLFSGTRLLIYLCKSHDCNEGQYSQSVRLQFLTPAASFCARTALIFLSSFVSPQIEMSDLILDTVLKTAAHFSRYTLLQTIPKHLHGVCPLISYLLDSPANVAAEGQDDLCLMAAFLPLRPQQLHTPPLLALSLSPSEIN